MVMTAQFELASILRSQGKLRESLRMYEKTLQMPGSEDPDRKLKSLSVGFAYLRKAQVYLEWNDLEKTLQLAREGLRICKLWGYSDYLYNGWFVYASILYAIGDLDGALDAIREATHTFQEFSPADRVHALEAVIHTAKGDFTRAEDWIKRSGLSAEDMPDFLHQAEYFHFARILAAQGKLDEARQILDRLVICAEEAGTVILLLNYITLQAVIILDLGDKEKALSLIRRALGLAEAEGFVRVFINKGPGMEKLLHEAVAAGIHPDYARELLGKFGDAIGIASKEKPRPGATTEDKMRQVMVEPLSERELEILRLLEGSLNTPEIARELYISVGTVRTHIKNIYRKLDASRRTEAVQHAREMGLI